MRDRFAFIFVIAAVLSHNAALSAPSGAGQRNAQVGNQLVLGAQFMGRAAQNTEVVAAPAPLLTEQPAFHDIRPDFLKIYEAYRQSLADARKICRAGQDSVDNIVGELGKLLGASAAQIVGGGTAGTVGAINIGLTQKTIDDEKELLKLQIKIADAKVEVKCLEDPKLKKEIKTIFCDGKETMDQDIRTLIDECKNKLLAGTGA